MSKEDKSWFLKHPIFSVFLLIFVLGLFMGFIRGLTGNVSKTQYQPQKVYVDKSYQELKEIFRGSSKYTDIQKDKIFDEQLKGRYVEWNGKINDIDTSMLDNLRLYVNIKENIIFDDRVVVYMNKDQYNKLIQLNKDDDVTFSGKFDSYGTILGVTFYFKDGELIEPEPEKPKSCTDECTESRCMGTDYFACTVGEDGCKHEEYRGIEFGRCGVECEEDSNCKKSMGCVKYKCIEKQETQTKTTTKETTTKSTADSGGFLDELGKALEELSESLSESSELNSKLDECTRVCAGDDYDTPLIRDEFYSVCYQLYYALGMEGLEEEIERCKNQE